MSRSALIVGVGGLGCPAALGLARAGFERLTLVDPDRVEVSNLHRQPLHSDADIGRFKVESAADKLRAAFPALRVETIAAAVRAHTAVALFRGHEVVIDATDGAATKFMLSDASVLSGIPLIYAGAVRLEGCVMAIRPDGPCLRCLFETPPSADASAVCSEAGVLGPVPGVIGGLQALAAAGVALTAFGKSESPNVRHVGHSDIRTFGQRISGEGEADLASFDARTLAFRLTRVKKASDCRACSPAGRAVLQMEAEIAGCAA